MKKKPSSDPLSEPEAAAQLSNPEWVALHLPRFAKADVQRKYKVYARFLEACLGAACARLAPLARVEARVKGIGSFADKILRKRKKYQEPSLQLPPDPLVRLTDLCGGRVIAETSSQVEAVCRFIEEAFEIDRANTEDVRQRLKPTQFGYRSVHYIVIPSEERLRKAGIEVPVPKAIHGLKAEIQVRTLLEHAWSDLGHDLLYKSDLRVPVDLERQFAAMAALLESADREFERLLEAFADYRASLGAHHSRAELREELARLAIILKHDPNNLGLAMRLARIALAIGAHAVALAELDGHRHRKHPEILKMVGILLVELHWDAPRSAGAREGLALLEQACQALPDDAEAQRALGDCHAELGRPARARECYQRAMAADPTDPVTVARFLEFEVPFGGAGALQLPLPMIRAACNRAHKQIDARVNLAGAWSALAVLELMAGNPFAALAALCQLMTLCRHSRAEADAIAAEEARKNAAAGKAAARGAKRPKAARKPVAAANQAVTCENSLCAPCRCLMRTVTAIEHLRTHASQIEGFAWFDRLLLIARARILDEQDAQAELRRVRSKDSPLAHDGGPVVIFAGACKPEAEPFIATAAAFLKPACAQATFTIISGGTKVGIAGVAGDVAKASAGRITAIGYLPKKPPAYTEPDNDRQRYAWIHLSEGTDFTPLEPLQGWTDLLAAGVDPASVRMICCAPGEIARCEVAIALALGAKVGLIEVSGLPRERVLDEPVLTNAPGLLPLPLDIPTIAVFLALDPGPLSPEDRRRFEPAARLAHQNYVQSATPRDPALRDWKDLDPALQESNFQQVVFWARVLAAHGLRVRELTAEEAADEARPLLDMKAVLGEDVIEFFAKLEHGRWNIERLGYGWRYALEKDVGRRLSPSLVPWEQLPAAIQEWDFKAILEMPAKLRAAGLEIELAR